jgi:hypothetical protein
MFPTRATWFITTSLPGRFLAAPEAVPTLTDQRAVTSAARQPAAKPVRASMDAQDSRLTKARRPYSCVTRNGCLRVGSSAGRA